MTQRTKAYLLLCMPHLGVSFVKGIPGRELEDAQIVAPAFLSGLVESLGTGAETLALRRGEWRGPFRQGEALDELLVVIGPDVGPFSLALPCVVWRALLPLIVPHAERRSLVVLDKTGRATRTAATRSIAALTARIYGWQTWQVVRDRLPGWLAGIVVAPVVAVAAAVFVLRTELRANSRV